MVVIERGGEGRSSSSRGGARDADGELRRRLRVPALPGDPGAASTPARRRPAGGRADAPWSARSAATRRCSCARRRWTGGSGCRRSWARRAAVVAATVGDEPASACSSRRASRWRPMPLSDGARRSSTRSPGAVQRESGTRSPAGSTGRASPCRRARVVDRRAARARAGRRRPASACWHFNDRRLQQRRGGVRRPGRVDRARPDLAPFFPVFRAHPLLFQSIVSIGYQFDWGDWCGRFAASCSALATVLLVFELGRLLYGRGAGLLAAGDAGRDAVPRGGHAAGAAGRAADVLRHAHPLPARALRGLGAAYWLLRDRLGARPGRPREGAGILFCGAVYAFFALAPQVADPAPRPRARARP